MLMQHRHIPLRRIQKKVPLFWFTELFGLHGIIDSIDFLYFIVFYFSDEHILRVHTSPCFPLLSWYPSQLFFCWSLSFGRSVNTLTTTVAEIRSLFFIWGIASLPQSSSYTYIYFTHKFDRHQLTQHNPNFIHYLDSHSVVLHLHSLYCDILKYLNSKQVLFLKVHLLTPSQWLLNIFLLSSSLKTCMLL